MLPVVTIYTLFVAILVSAALLSVAYLLLFVVSAARKSVSLPPTPVILPSLCIVIPAHNEELVLAATLHSLQQQNYSADRFQTVVIADNCNDTTANIARQNRVRVLERRNEVERGKGYALAWAFDILLNDAHPADAYVILDADTWAEPDFLKRMAARFADGQAALQGRYGVLNAHDGWRAALMSGAFELVNHVRLLGADALGLFVGLKGNGMLFGRDILLKAKWSGHSITEDIDYGLDLLTQHNIAVRYVPEARVQAQMPTTAKQAASQRSRWEGGRYRLLRERFGILFKMGLQRRDARLLDAAVGFLVPPLSELVLLIVLATVAVVLGYWTHWLRLPTLWMGLVVTTAVGFATYILGGFRVAGAKANVYAALLQAPFYTIWKLLLYAAKPFAKAKTGEWVRTERAPIAPPLPSDTVSSPVAQGQGEVL